MNNVLQERSRRVWRAIAAAGRKGIGSIELREHFAGVIDAAPLKVSLQGLSNGGYAVADGHNRWSRWKITADCRVPAGEEAPAWLSEPADDDAEIVGDGNQRCAPPKVPSAPMSVFTMAQSLSDKPDLGEDAPETATEKPTTSSLDWKPPQGLANNVFRDNSIAPDETSVTEILVGGAGPAIECVSRKHAPDPLHAHRDPDFQCHLDSDGDLFIRSGEDLIELPLPHVRKLFRYLDRLRGDELVEQVMGELR